MNGPINSERETLEKRSKLLERSLVLAGVVVLAGLIGESRTISALLVTIGVFAEVVLGIFITKIAGQIQDLANASVAAANERAARAEQAAAEANERIAEAERATAEANLARARIEEKFRRRILDRDAQEELALSLSKYPKFRIDVVVFDKEIEAITLGDMIAHACRKAGCDCRLFLANTDRHKIPETEGVTLARATDATPEENDIVPFVVTAVAAALFKSKIRYATAFGGFKKDDPVEPHNFRGSTVVDWDSTNVAPGRIQVSAKNLLDFNWPVTPPQA